MSQKAKRLISNEKFNQRSIRMFSDLTEISEDVRYSRKDYKYSDANRDRMRDIVNNPTKFSEDEKINTLLSFHKDTCANIISQLYPSNGDDDALEDLKILKSFEPVLAGLELECRQTYSKASYENFRAKKQLLQKKIAMSVVLKSPDAAVLQEDIKIWMMQKLVEYNDEKDDGYYKNDEERLEGLEEGKNNALSYLRKLGVDMSEYRDSDASDQYLNGQPIQVTIDEYKLLEKVITRTCDKMDQLSEDAYPIAQYLGDIKRHVEIFEEHLTKVANADIKRSQKLYRRRRQMNRQKNTRDGPGDLGGNRILREQNILTRSPSD